MYLVYFKFISKFPGDRDQLNTKSNEEVAGPSPKPDEEPEDFSPSGSSWVPSGDDDSGDSDHVSNLLSVSFLFVWYRSIYALECFVELADEKYDGQK